MTKSSLLLFFFVFEENWKHEGNEGKSRQKQINGKEKERTKSYKFVYMTALYATSYSSHFIFHIA